MQDSCAPSSAAPHPPVADRRGRRSTAALVVAFCAGVLLLAAWMEPSSRGLGTHLQLGLAPCGWVAYGGIPCPSCGMTTAFAHATDGNLLGALRAQPAGALLAFLTACALVVAGWQLVTGDRMLGFWTDRLGSRFFMVVAAVVVLAWVYKILVFKDVL